MKKESDTERRDFQIRALEQIILGRRGPQLDHIGLGAKELDFDVGSNAHFLCSLTFTGCQGVQNGEELERNLGEEKKVIKGKGGF